MHHRAPTSGAFFMACAAGLAALAALPYLNSIHGPWILDDLPIISRNSAVRELRYRELWTSDYWRTTGDQAIFYRPLTMTTYALNRAFGGLGTTGFHVVNVALHVACTLILWRLCLGGACTFAALTAAGIFAVHPVHVEAVANVVGRSELLMAFFFLMTLNAHHGLRRAPAGRRKGVWAALMFVTAAAMLFSKESGVALIAFFPLYDYVARRKTAEIKPPQKAAYLALGCALALYLVLRLMTVGLSPGAPVQSDLSLRFQLTSTSALKNLQLLIAPAGQRAIWQHSDMPAPDSYYAIAGAGILLVMLAVAGVCIMKRRSIAPPIVLLLVSMAPLLHIKPNTIWVWERGLYVPSAALIWLLYEGLFRVQQLRVARVVYAATIVVIVVFAVKATVLSGLYANALRFYEYQYEVDKSAGAAMNYTQALLQQRRPELRACAVEVAEAALRDHPEEGVLVSGLAEFYLIEGRLAEANEVLTSASLRDLRFFTAAQQRLLLKRLAEQSEKAGATEAARLFAGDLEALPPLPDSRR